MQYSIEARSLSIPNKTYMPNIASHNFWVLKNEKGQVLAELHGLAIDRVTGKIMTIGYDEEKHSLRARHMKYETPDQFTKKYKTFYYESNQEQQIVFKSDAKEVLQRWNAAVKAINYINQKDLNYPALGVNIIGKTINSNSTYRTLGEIMGIKIHQFKNKLQPGLDYKMLTEQEIKHFKYQETINYDD